MTCDPFNVTMISLLWVFFTASGLKTTAIRMQCSLASTRLRIAEGDGLEERQIVQHSIVGKLWMYSIDSLLTREDLLKDVTDSRRLLWFYIPPSLVVLVFGAISLSKMIGVTGNTASVWDSVDCLPIIHFGAQQLLVLLL